MGIADLIEQFLLNSIEGEDKLVIKRNNLAEHFSCAPSQINYVLTTRFNPDHGFSVESKRGGGGYVTVIRISQEKDYLSELLSELKGQPMSYQRARAVLSKLVLGGFLSEREGRLILASMSEKCFLTKGVDEEISRGIIFKNVLLQLIKEKSND